MSFEDRGLLTPTALVTLDAVLEATGAHLRLVAPSSYRTTQAWARLETEDASASDVQAALDALRSRGLLRGLVLRPMVWRIGGPDDPADPRRTVVLLTFRRTSASRWRAVAVPGDVVLAQGRAASRSRKRSTKR